MHDGPLEAALARGISERTKMAIAIYRAVELYNTPPRRGRPGKRGKFNCGKSHFYEVIEPQLEKVKLGPKATAYTARKLIEDGIARATAERAVAQVGGS